VHRLALRNIPQSTPSLFLFISAKGLETFAEPADDSRELNWVPTHFHCELLASNNHESLAKQLISINYEPMTKAEALPDVVEIGDDTLCGAHKRSVLLDTPLNLRRALALGVPSYLLVSTGMTRP
jgi:hypothetical protein